VSYTEPIGGKTVQRDWLAPAPERADEVENNARCAHSRNDATRIERVNEHKRKCASELCGEELQLWDRSAGERCRGATRHEVVVGGKMMRYQLSRET
jgi:hypothetical protein